MRLRPLIPLTAAVALVMPAAARAQYAYTRIAATGAGSGFAGLYAPQINQVGSVAFGATLTSGNVANPQGIFVGTMGVVVPIVQNGTGSQFTGFNFPPGPIVAAIAPNSNMTAFFASRAAAQGGDGGRCRPAGPAQDRRRLPRKPLEPDRSDWQHPRSPRAADIQRSHSGSQWTGLLALSTQLL